MATTAVIAGTAGAVSHRQQERYQAKAMQQQQAMQTQQAPAPAPAAAAPAGGSDVMAQLEQLSAMQAAGLLTPEQFEAAKNKLLGM